MNLRLYDYDSVVCFQSLLVLGEGRPGWCLVRSVGGGDRTLGPRSEHAERGKLAMQCKIRRCPTRLAVSVLPCT